LIAATTRYGVWLAGFSDACDRLVHGGVVDEDARARHRRFIGAALAGSFASAGLIAFAFAGALPVAMLMAALCTVLALGWMTVLAATLSGETRIPEIAALAFCSAVIAASVAGSGGAASPLMLLALAPVVEAFGVARSRRSLLAGAVAGFCVLPLQALFGAFILPGNVMSGVSALDWMAPALYALMAWPRLGALLQRESKSVDAVSLQAVATAAGAVVLRLSPSGEVIEAAESEANAIGIEFQPGESLLRHVHVADRVACISALAGLGQGEGRRNVPARLRVGAGAGAKERFAPCSLEITAAEDGELLAVLRDETRVATLEAMLDEASEKAERGELAKSRFLGAVSHELRTPLNAIIGFSDMMLHGMAGVLADERQSEYVGLIKASGEHLLSVVNSILDVSRIEAGAYGIRPEPFPVKDALDLTRSMMAHLAEVKGVALTMRVRPDIGEINGDRRAVQQMIINLLSNAIKFTPAGGSVELEAVRYGSRISFSVADTGIGISQNDLCRIGQPFVQASNDVTREFEGTGLGLSVVKGLVRLHDGEMTIESDPGEGTRVTITLPVAGPGQVEGTEGDAPGAKPAPKLLIDNGDRNEAFRKRA